MLLAKIRLYNFSIPSQLKHYIDFIARAGETFK
ncbi:NAD(P)H-dependent oxidoreductase, partial [Proteus mirabilis]